MVATLQTARYFYDAIFHRNHPCSAFNVFFSLAPISFFLFFDNFQATFKGWIEIMNDAIDSRDVRLTFLHIRCHANSVVSSNVAVTMCFEFGRGLLVVINR